MPTQETNADAVATAARFTTIGDRLAVLRQQTAELTARSTDIAARTRELREGPRHACGHAGQVQEMQQSLDAVERELDGLRTAMLTRGVIERAKGMLMLQQQCDADDAFAALVQLSQTSNRRLVDVAQTLVEAWSTGNSAPA